MFKRSGGDALLFGLAPIISATSLRRSPSSPSNDDAARPIRLQVADVNARGRDRSMSVRHLLAGWSSNSKYRCSAACAPPPTTVIDLALARLLVGNTCRWWQWTASSEVNVVSRSASDLYAEASPDQPRAVHFPAGRSPGHAIFAMFFLASTSTW
jgi:hypothetical protein